MKTTRIPKHYRLGALAILLASLAAFPAHAQPDGFLAKDGARLFPIGFYELPGEDAALQAMAGAGVNLVHCHSREDLDRIQAVGMLGVFPLPFQNGDTDALRARVTSVADHPALAVWEGPDEVVWNFTAYSGLHKKLEVHKTPGEWWRQTPEAVAYAGEQAARIMPKMRAAVDMIRGMDTRARPVWINEAVNSDTYYVRQYMDFIDITGCDSYPIGEKKRDVASLGRITERWKQVGRGKPVWMVLQAFSWDELGDYYGAKKTVYPTFDESRFMAYDVITHGARGILYWGSRYLKSDEFRQSLYALTSELAALQPFLVAPDVPDTRLSVVEVPDEKTVPHVQMLARKAQEDWLIILVNEDNDSHMGVVVEGLNALDGQDFHLLYGAENTAIAHGELITRMQGHEVKVFCTDRKWETPRREGRTGQL